MKRLLIALALIIATLLAPLPLNAQVEAYDIIIMNGRIVDGSGNPWFYGDVAIRGDRIIKVGKVGPARAKRQQLSLHERGQQAERALAWRRGHGTFKVDGVEHGERHSREFPCLARRRQRGGRPDSCRRRT